MTSTAWVNVSLVYPDPAKFGDVGPQVSLPPPHPRRPGDTALGA